ncbi:MAG: hypothetical protein H5T86_09915 [Armatimonadetes bacterium]|nr:hypothetical protein [Armatimonadota bacterium]
MQWLLTAILAAVLLIPGVEILRFVLVDWTGLYDKLTLADACLVYIVILQTAILVQLVLWHRELQWERMAERPPHTYPRRSAAPERAAAAGRGTRGERGGRPPASSSSGNHSMRGQSPHR